MEAVLEDIGNFKLAVYERSGTGLPIVFVHGNSSNAQAFEQIWNNPLLSNFRLFALDLPGHGKSSKALHPDEYKVLNQSRLLADFIEKKKLEHTIVVGHSLGGHIAIHALEFTKRIAGMMLMGTGPVENASGFEKGYNLHEDILALFRNEVTEEELNKALLLEVHHEKHQQIIRDSFFRTDGVCRETLGKDLGTYFASEGFVSELYLLSKPGLLVAFVQGEYEKLIVLEYLENLTGINYWKGKVHIITDAAHCAPFESPDQLAVLVRDFALDVSRQF